MEKAIKILEQEVEWHQKNRVHGPSKDWLDGFIKGCEHCYKVLVSCQSVSTSPKTYPRGRKLL